MVLFMNTGRYQDSGKPDSEYYTLFKSFTVSSLYPVLVFVVHPNSQECKYIYMTCGGNIGQFR